MTLTLPVKRTGPYGRSEDHLGITVMLPDGTLHTIAPDHLADEL